VGLSKGPGEAALSCSSTSRRSGSIPRGAGRRSTATRLGQYGSNQAAEERSHPLLALLGKFWAPVPWMLELTVVIELLLGRHAVEEMAADGSRVLAVAAGEADAL
jgi:magnesium-transporting ATPase (P-type)